MNSGVLLKAVNLHKVFLNGGRKLEVLKGIDIEIKKEEIVSLIGPSGAGKSTLLHLLAGLDTPAAGEVWFEDGNLYRLRDEERAKLRNERFGFVFQFYNLLPEFTALENVMLPGWINRRDAKREAIEFLKEVGLAERFTHRPAELSGGEQQRVAIARALVNQPRMLFCDEPTGNLDSESGQQVCQLLWRLCRRNHSAMIIVTHEEKIARQADRIIRIEDGRFVNS